MTKALSALTGLMIALTLSSGALAQVSDSKSGGQPPQKLVEKAKKGPLAFGFVNSDGSVASGSGNFTASVSSNLYTISIKKVSYYYSSFATIVTPAVPDVSYCTTDSVGGNLLVHCYNSSGASTPASFAFVTF